MQINTSPVYVSLPTTLRTLWRNERVAGLSRGLTASMMRETFNSVRIGSYDVFRRRFAKADGETTALRRLVAGLCAGACGSFAGRARLTSQTRLKTATHPGNPFELVKVRFQTTTPGVNRPAPYTNTWTTLVHIFRHEGGVVGLYKGLALTGRWWRGALARVNALMMAYICVSTVARAALVTGTQMSSYDTIKRLFARDNAATHVASALCAALVTTTATSPVDVIKTRYMHDDASRHRYASMRECAVATWRNEGARAFHRAAGRPISRASDRTSSSRCPSWRHCASCLVSSTYELARARANMRMHPPPPHSTAMLRRPPNRETK